MERRRDLALLALRAFVGVAFFLHGAGKLPHLVGFAQEFGLPLGLARAAAYVQLAGGVLLVAGALTPFATLGLAATMAVAIAKLVLRGEPFISPGSHSWESAAFYLVSCAAIAATGPGAYSIDALAGILVRRPRRARSSPAKSSSVA